MIMNTKKQKIVFFLLLIFTLMVTSYLPAKSKRIRKASKISRKRIVNTINRKEKLTNNENKSTNIQIDKIDSVTKTDTNLENITKYNCENFYIKCMDKSCFNENNGRCACNSNQLFNTTHQSCKYILNKFPYLETEFIDNYKRTAKQHCSSYTINNIKGNYTTTELADLTECMQKKCNSKQGAFINCFDKEKYEQKLQSCNSTYKNSNDKNLVLEMFENSMMQYKTKYCNENFGILKNGNCYITIGIGPSLKVITAKKEFKIGDKFVCSEEFFNTDIGHSKILNLEQGRDIALYALDLTKGINNAAHTIARGVKTDNSGIASMEGINEIIGTATGSGHFQDAVVAMAMKKEKKEELSKYKGACYIIKNNQTKLITEMSNEFYYTLKWTASWNNEKREVDEN